MASVGPQLPPSVGGKRKRDGDEEQHETSDSPVPRAQSPGSASKHSRTIGPTLPPANLDERPSTGPDSDSEGSSDDDDDGFGPSLPPAGGAATSSSTDTDSKNAASIGPQVPTQVKRDEWMTMAPTSGDWSSRVDPTKLKNRKFNTGKGAKGPSLASGGDNSIWHETPAEKQERLRREVLGIKDAKQSREAGEQVDEKTAETLKKLKDYNEKARGPTLYAAHQKSNPREKEDDPSARAFDREKDIAGGMKINTTQRRELMNKAADFGTRFSSAKYL